MYWALRTCWGKCYCKSTKGLSLKITIEKLSQCAPWRRFLLEICNFKVDKIITKNKDNYEAYMYLLCATCTFLSSSQIYGWGSSFYVTWCCLTGYLFPHYSRQLGYLVPQSLKIVELKVHKTETSNLSRKWGTN